MGVDNYMAGGTRGITVDPCITALLTTDNELITNSHTYAIDEIGIIYEGGTYDAEGVVITPPTALPGWHVNTLGIAPEAWDEFQIIVKSASRIFFGGPTNSL